MAVGHWGGAAEGEGRCSLDGCGTGSSSRWPLSSDGKALNCMAMRQEQDAFYSTARRGSSQSGPAGPGRTGARPSELRRYGRPRHLCPLWTVDATPRCGCTVPSGTAVPSSCTPAVRDSASASAKSGDGNTNGGPVS
jgi:hypothetical protein